MALRPADVEIVRPCPVDLDETGLRGTGRNWHCGHCSKTVHVLSTMTETEARVFLRDHAGEDLCVSYAISPLGEVRFRPEPIVPVAALARRPLRVAAAAGLGLALAACAPHDNPEVRATSQEVIAAPLPGGPTIPAQVEPKPSPPSPPPEDRVVDGMMRRPDLQVEGRLRPVAPADEPCDAPVPTATKRGKMKSTP